MVAPAVSASVVTAGRRLNRDRPRVYRVTGYSSVDRRPGGGGEAGARARERDREKERDREGQRE